MHRTLVLAAAVLIAASCDDTTAPAPDVPDFRVTVITIGVDAPASYALQLGDGPPRQVDVNSVTLLVPPGHGTYLVFLSGIPVNCSATSSVTTSELEGVAAEVEFRVTCVARSSTLRVKTLTTGNALDPDGYRVLIDDAPVGRVGANDQTEIEGVRPGAHLLRLSDVAENCAASPEIAITTVFQHVTSLQLDITCDPIARVIAYSASTIGGWDIFAIRANSTGVQRLTTASGRDVDPDWSHDDRIAFASERDGNFQIYTMNADGGQQTRITNGSAGDRQPSWSPDGSRIAFSRLENGRQSIYVVNADGSGLTRITNGTTDSDPAWSPSGTQIAFIRESQLHVMNVDGSSVTSLGTPEAVDFGPAWSPDGARLALTRYHYTVGFRIYTLNPHDIEDVNWVDDGYNPSWSPDGSRVVFTTDSPRICQAVGCVVSTLVTGGRANGRRVVVVGEVAGAGWRRK